MCPRVVLHAEPSASSTDAIVCVCARACVVPKRGIRSGLPARASLLPGEEGSGGRLGPHRLSRSMVCIGGHDPGPRRSLHSGEPGSLASIGLRHGLALVRRHQAESNPSTGHRAAEAVNQRPSVRRPRPVKRIARSRFPVTTSVSPNRIGTHCLLQTTQPFCSGSALGDADAEWMKNNRGTRWRASPTLGRFGDFLAVSRVIAGRRTTSAPSWACFGVSVEHPERWPETAQAAPAPPAA